MVFPQQQENVKCSSIVHIGDSTTLPMLGYIKSDYEKVGFDNVVISAGNGRSIAYSRPPDTMNGIQVVRYWKQRLSGNICWVVALGTNDAASTSSPDDPTRIKLIMTEIGNDKVLWVNVWVDSKQRPEYSVRASVEWNALLIRTMKSYKNAKIFDWATIAKSNPGWFISDGIHYNSIGAKQRSTYITVMAGLLLQ
jgi:hypothetical protein